MRKISVCLNNTLAGTLIQESQGSESFFTFCYEKSYLEQPDAIPLSLSLPLKAEPQKHPVIGNYFRELMGSPDHCFKECSSSSIGTVSFGPQITKQPRLYSPLSTDHLEKEIFFTKPLENTTNKSSSLFSLKERQPFANTTVIDSTFYSSPFSLLKTHILKKEFSKDDDLITNEIFTTLIAYQLEIPVPTISRFMIEGDYVLLMDRPDREASISHTALPTFRHCETLETALISSLFKVKDKDKKPLESYFDLLRQQSSQPAVDFRTLIRTIMVCLTAGIDDFKLSDALIALKPKGCRLHQVRHFICADIYKNTSKHFLQEVFAIDNIEKLQASHFDDLARKIRVNHKYLKSQALAYALVIPKIASTILSDYPSLRTEITFKITDLMKKRTNFIEKILL